MDTDTLLYWESSVRGELRLKQEEYWGSALQKFSSKMDLPALKITNSLFYVAQDEKILCEFDTFLSDLNEFQLASNQLNINLVASLILLHLQVYLILLRPQNQPFSHGDWPKTCLSQLKSQS